MVIVLLYAVIVLVWGTTWLAIKYQLGVVAPEISVLYRFAMAALVMFCWAWLRGDSLRFKLRDHGFLALMGAFIFSTNYVLFYIATAELTTGLIAVIFSTAKYRGTSAAEGMMSTTRPRNRTLPGAMA